ncbi:MAG: stealth family protein [Rikenellaceae bacterium]
MKIDLVYTWVNCSDPAWIEKRRYNLPNAGLDNQEAFGKARTSENNELLYSLRSVEIYAPWINHIFIVTDQQTPEWLDATNEKITIVDHRDIIPAEVLPMFNSTAIEQCLHKIEGLSEHFLYANDDTMFGRDLSPDFFFTSAGKIIYRVTHQKGFYKNLVDNSGIYFTTILRVNREINGRYGLDCLDWRPAHTIDAYTKSSITKCLSEYREWGEETLKSRFRRKEDMQRYMFSLWAVANGDAVVDVIRMRWIPYIELFVRTIEDILVFLRLKKGVKSLYISIADKQIHRTLLLKRPALVCFNDEEYADDNDRVSIQEVMKRIYPKKSSFEK